MSIIQQVAIIVAVVYGSLLLGILLKFKQNGLKGATLWLAPFVPILVFIIPILMIGYMESAQFTQKYGKRTIKHKVKVVGASFILTLVSFPLIVGVVGEILTLIFSARRKKSALVDEAIPYVRHIYEEAFAF